MNYFDSRSPVYLDTAEYRLFADPYGPHHSGAVGKVYHLESIQGGEYSAVDVSYADVISPLESPPPELFNPRVGITRRIRVEREWSEDGKTHLEAEIISTRDGTMLWDSGIKLHIVLRPRRSRLGRAVVA
jgi:hypothetical protein